MVVSDKEVNMAEEMWQIGVCIECHSDQPASYMMKTKFQNPPCKYCGGVVNIINYTGSEDRNRFLSRKDAERGLGISVPGEED